MSVNDHIQAENVARTVLTIESLRSKKALNLTSVDLEELDKPSEAETKGTPVRNAYLRHLEPAQETEAERVSRFQQIEYEQNGSYAENKILAKSINTLAQKNFTNRVFAAACDFTEMAEHHQRSPFIENFGDLIEEELKANPSKPSKRLASFATTYFWKEANWARLVAAVQPETTRAELTEFFMLSLNSEPEKKVINFIPGLVMNDIFNATNNPENREIKFDIKKKQPYVSIREGEELISSITGLARKNFTNRILSSTTYFDMLANPFNNVHTVNDFGRDLEHELRENPDKPSKKLVTLLTERPFEAEDIKLMIDSVTPETTKQELSEFLTTRESWSTGLRMIDYLNHQVVTEMTRYLPEQDKLDIWALKPELVNGFNVGESLRKFSPESQKKILDTIKDPEKREYIQEKIANRIVGLHVSSGLMEGGSLNPNTIEITGNFSDIRRRRICSHEDNRRFFPTSEHFRSSY